MAFNGYREWLGIETGGAIHYYRLLGLPIHEGDPPTIAAAVKRRRQQLQPHLDGPRHDVAVRILTELAAAKQCLCDSELKQAYDEKLRRLTGQTAAAPESSLRRDAADTTEAPLRRDAADALGAKVDEEHPPIPPFPGEVVESAVETAVETAADDSPAATAPQPLLRRDAAATLETPLRRDAAATLAVPAEGAAEAPQFAAVDTVRAKRVRRSAGGWPYLLLGLASVAAFLFAVWSLQPSFLSPTSGTSEVTESTANRPAPLQISLPKNVAAQEHRETTLPLAVTGDVDASDVAYRLLGTFPPEMQIDESHTLRWTPGELDGGRDTDVQIEARAGEQTSVGSLRVAVREVNRPPRLAPVATQTVEADRESTIQLAATDADLPAQNLSYELISGPAGARLEPDTGLLRVHPTAFDVGDPQPVAVRVRDERGASATLQFMLQVTHPPQVAAAPPKQKPPPRPAPVRQVVRRPVPEQAAVRAAEQLFRETFADELERAKSSEAKSDLAGKLVEHAAALEDVPAETYVLLQEAAKLAVEAGDATVVTGAADRLGEYFELPAYQQRARLLIELGRGRNTGATTNQARLVRFAIETVKLAIAADDLETADAMSLLAVRAAGSLDDPRLVDQAAEVKKEISILRRQFSGLPAALASARQADASADACALAGSWLCLVRGEWRKGLPLLARGDDEALQPLAAADLANPSDPTEQVAVADRWWQAAETLQGIARWQLRQRAAHWYRAAQPELKGLVQRKVVQRLEEAKSDGESLLARVLRDEGRSSAMAQLSCDSFA